MIQEEMKNNLGQENDLGQKKPQLCPEKKMPVFRQ